MTGFIFKLVGFDHVKISVVYLFPQTNKFDCGPKPHTILNNIQLSYIAWLLQKLRKTAFFERKKFLTDMYQERIIRMAKFDVFDTK